MDFIDRDAIRKGFLGDGHIYFFYKPKGAGIKFALFRLSTDSLMPVKKQIGSLPDTEKTADILTDLRLEKEKFPTEPIFK